MVQQRIFVVSIVATCLATLAGAQDRRTVWDGVYSSAQANRGRAAYTSNCARCHGDALEGHDAPALVGDTFMRNWGESTLASLLSKVEAMPPKTQTARTREGNADLVAYILETNQFPAGGADFMPGADAVDDTVIVEREGQAIPNFSLVRVVGCVTETAERTWVLTRASDPVRTRNPAASSGTELTNAQATPLGTHTFRLLSLYPSPGAHKGHRMEVKGFLIRIPNDDRINVSAIEMLGTTCGE